MPRPSMKELLVGSTPFDAQELMSQGLDAMRRTIREKEPVQPSTRLATLDGEELTTTAKPRSLEPPKLIHLLKGDLDWIAMKCLEKDRTRRYKSASGLAADLKRYLDHEPVVGRPPSAAYRAQKFVRRNKVMVGAAGLRLAVTSTGPETVKLWDVESRQELLTLESRESRFVQGAFSPDGNHYGALSMEGYLHLWSAPSWAEIAAAEAKDLPAPGYGEQGKAERKRP